VYQKLEEAIGVC